jgi:DNA-binding sugar fermentation-stimulating protein
VEKISNAQRALRAITVFLVLMVVFSLNINENLDNRFLSYAIPAAVAGIAVYLAIYLVDYLSSKIAK